MLNLRVCSGCHSKKKLKKQLQSLQVKFCKNLFLIRTSLIIDLTYFSFCVMCIAFLCVTVMFLLVIIRF